MLQPHKVRIALRPVASKIKARASRPADGQMPFKVERVFFTLRWLTIALAVAIQLYSATNASKTESFVTALLPTALVAIYNGLFMSLRYGLADRRVIVWLSGLDTLVIAFAIGETGGIYSPFLLLLYLVVVESAFNFSPNNALTFTAFIGAVYIVAAMFLAGQVWNELTITIVMGEVMLMFILVTISSSMVNALEHQKGLVQRERELSAQLNRQVKALSSLNRLSERLHASLEIEELMQRTVEALPEALEVAACVAFLARRDNRDEWQISSSWYGIDEEFEPFDQPQSGNIQAGPLVLERAELDRVIEGGETLRLGQDGGEAILVVPLRPDDSEGGALALLRQTGPAFAESDLELLAALGRQMSLLIKNARLYEQEKQNVVRLQELETMKSDFLSVVSHELRTPITSIKASNILMMTQPDGEVTDRDMRLLKNIDRNTERLNGLVSDLLDMAKLQHGRVKLSLQPHNLAEIAVEVVGCVRPLADSKGQRLEIEQSNERGEVLADRRRLEQIITNLVSNAVRYTPKGGHIVVRLCQQNGQSVLSVQDDGPGIAPHEQELIWERFYRVPQQASKTGTGLGLAIARSLVELHGGRIWLDSTPGRGSTFSFALPLYTPKANEPIFLHEGQMVATVNEK